MQQYPHKINFIKYGEIRNQDVYEYKEMPFMKRCKRYFRQVDFYANPITLRYKGEKKFYTNFGALTSSLIIAAMVALAIYQFSILVTLSQVSFQANTRLVPPTDFLLGQTQDLNNLLISPGNGFVFAYRILNKETRKPFDDETYFTAAINQFEQKWQTQSKNQFNNSYVDDIQIPVTSSTNIGVQKCQFGQIKTLGDLSQEYIDRIQMDTFKCPSTATYKIRGTQLDDQFIYTHLSVYKCNQTLFGGTGKTCKSEKQINQMMSQLEIQFAFLNANFDQSDINDPIKYGIIYHFNQTIRQYIDVRLFEGLITGFQKKIDIFIKNSQATLMNDYLRLKDPQNLQFFQVDQIEKYLNLFDEEDGEVIRFTLLASSKSEAYERKVFSIVDMFALLGGIYNSLFTLGFLFCAAFSYNLFLSSLIRKLYHFKARFASELASNKKNKKEQKKKKGCCPCFKKGKGGDKKEKDRRKTKTRRYTSKVQQTQQDEYPQEDEINNDEIENLNLSQQRERDNEIGVNEIKDEIQQVIGRKDKANFNHKTVSILKSLVCCWASRKRSYLRYEASRRNVLFFLKGREKLSKELDLANVILNIRKVKYLMRILLEKDQRRLLQLKQTEFISSDEGEVDTSIFKKSLKKDKLVDLYVDQLRSKKLKKSDTKLLEITGFKNVISILKSQKALEKVTGEWGDQDTTPQYQEMYNNQRLNLYNPGIQSQIALVDNNQLTDNDRYNQSMDRDYDNSKKKLQTQSSTKKLLRTPIMNEKREKFRQSQQKDRNVRNKTSATEFNVEQIYDSEEEIVSQSIVSLKKDYENLMNQQTKHKTTDKRNKPSVEVDLFAKQSKDKQSRNNMLNNYKDSESQKYQTRNPGLEQPFMQQSYYPQYLENSPHRKKDNIMFEHQQLQQQQSRDSQRLSYYSLLNKNSTQQKTSSKKVQNFNNHVNNKNIFGIQSKRDDSQEDEQENMLEDMIDGGSYLQSLNASFTKLEAQILNQKQIKNQQNKQNTNQKPKTYERRKQ